MDEQINFEELKVNGIKINYYYICPRKLWLFDKGIGMENTSEKVLLGTLLHEDSYKMEKLKNILIDNTISIDILNKNSLIEVKSSDKMKEADRMQILYYLYYLKKMVGIDMHGIIRYPKLRKVESIVLTEEDEDKIEKALLDINKILKQDKPPSVINKPYCKRCAYYELCYV